LNGKRGGGRNSVAGEKVRSTSIDANDLQNQEKSWNEKE
jgi:hypothetical protein